MKARRLLLPSLVVAAVLAATQLGSASGATGASAPVKKKVSATFIATSTSSPTNCGWAIGIAFGNVPGATSYVVRYWDGYWKRTIETPLTPAQFGDKDVPKGQLPAGTHFHSVTGGWYSPPCSTAAGDPSGGGRFSKGAQAWAFLPAGAKPPQPKASIGVTVTPPAGVSVGESRPVKVTVTAGEVALTGVSVSGLGGGGNVAQVTSRPSGLSGFSLGASQSRTFTFTVKGLRDGAAALTAKATGRWKKGAVSGSGSGTFRVAKDALAITLSTTPGRVALEADDNGKIQPKTITVTAKLTNTGTSTIENVSLQSLNPEPVDKTQRLDQLALPRGSLPVAVGSLAPGAVQTKTFELKVTGDGEYQIRALALYATASGGTGRATGVGAKFEATVPALFFTSKLAGTGAGPNGSDGAWVKAGKTFFISGTVKNLSSYKHLCLQPLEAKRVGNASFTGPVDIARYGRNQIAPPLAGGLKPGEDVVWGVWAQTSVIGGTRATVTFDPKAVEVKPGASCGVERVLGMTPLPAKQVKSTAGSLEHVVRVDTSTVQFPPLSGGWRTLEFFGGMALAPSIAIGDVIQETIASCRELVTSHLTPEALLRDAFNGLAPVAMLRAQYQFYAAMAKTASVLANYWRTATPAEKQSLSAQVASTLRRGRDDAWAKTSESVSQIFAGYMKAVEAASADGDNPDVWRALGSKTAQGASRFVIDMALAELGTRLVKVTPTLRRTFAEIGDTSVTYTKLKGIPAGKLLNLTELQKLWGLATTDIAAFAKIAREENVLIGIRGRAPGSVQKLEGGAVWKHEAVKPKNVSHLDTKYLNFDEADLDLVAFKKYSPAEKQAILDRIERAKATLSEAEYAELVDRADTRFKEAGKYLDDLHAADQRGTIDIRFNPTENGYDVPTAPKPVGFKLNPTAEKIGGKRTGTVTYRPIQENTLLKRGQKLPRWCDEVLKKVLCRLTGDMDGVYLTSLDGGPLTKEKVLKVYKRLAEAGWQHPETLTWVEQMTGKFWFDAKERILRKHGLDGTPLVEFAPDEIRATYIDFAKSKLLDAATGSWRVEIAGGFAPLR